MGARLKERTRLSPPRRPFGRSDKRGRRRQCFGTSSQTCRRQRLPLSRADRQPQRFEGGTLLRTQRRQRGLPLLRSSAKFDRGKAGSIVLKELRHLCREQIFKGGSDARAFDSSRIVS